jgi:phosphohistidine phosphatase
MPVLYFVRHGAAEDAQQWLGSDFDRPLTSKGRKQMVRVVKRLAEAEIEVDVIATSPLVRAQETAKIVAERLGVERVLEDSRLADGFDQRKLLDILRDLGVVEHLMLVGHEPTMSFTVGRIIGNARLDFKKGAIACVDLPDATSTSGTLLWLSPPKLLIGT